MKTPFLNLLIISLTSFGDVMGTKELTSCFDVIADKYVSTLGSDADLTLEDCSKDEKCSGCVIKSSLPVPHTGSLKCFTKNSTESLRKGLSSKYGKGFTTYIKKSPGVCGGKEEPKKEVTVNKGAETICPASKVKCRATLELQYDGQTLTRPKHLKKAGMNIRTVKLCLAKDTKTCVRAAPRPSWRRKKLTTRRDSLIKDHVSAEWVVQFVKGGKSGQTKPFTLVRGS